MAYDSLRIGRQAARERDIWQPLTLEQDRWFLWVPVFFGAGIAIYFALPTEPDLLTATMPAVAALALRVVWRNGVASMVLTGAVLSLTLGLAMAKLRTEVVAAPILERELRNADVTGIVRRIEQRPTGGPRVTLLVTSLDQRVPAATPRYVRLSFLKPVPNITTGDHLKTRANLSPPPRPAMPGGYDFARWAFFKEIGAVGFSFSEPETIPLPGPLPWTLRVVVEVERLRQWIGMRVLSALPGQNGALANALITGERGGIDEEMNAAFRNSGLIHLLSISGLHMAVMGGFFFFLLRLALAAFPAAALRYPIKKWAAAGAIVASLGYLMISGGAIATIRAFIMISIAFSAIILDRPAIALRNVALAALLIMALMPESMFDPGFQMSFAAVVALVAAYEALRDRRAAQGPYRERGNLGSFALFLGGIVLTTLIAGFAVAPVVIFYFHTSQQYAVIANLVAIPLTNLVVMPTALVTLFALPFGLEGWPLAVMDWALDLIVWVAQTVSGLPGAVVPVPSIPITAYALIMTGGLWLAIWRRKWRLAGVAIAAVGLALAPFRSAPDVFIGADGNRIAFRTDEGSLATIGRGGRFELSRWLEADGDGRDLKAVSSGRPDRCDALGCVDRAKGRILALSRHPSSLADDCRLASILVLTYRRPQTCQGSALVIDGTALKNHGNHVITYTGDSLRVETVDGVRGNRPWVLQPRQRRLRVPKVGERKPGAASG